MRALLLVGGLMALSATASAQEMQSYTVSRQRHGDSRLTAQITFAAGHLTLSPGDDRTLYRMDLRYDRERFVPTTRYHSARAEVVLGLESTGGTGLRVSNRSQLRQSATVLLSPAVDLRIEAELGATESDLELGGLRLAGLRLRTGASRTRVVFSRPNRMGCDLLELQTGAADLTATGLGNSRCEAIRLEGGVGTVTLDFDGVWPQDMRLEGRITVGEVTLRVPRRVGVRITLNRFLAGFDRTGFVERGGVYYSTGYEAATRHLDIQLSSTLGGVSLVWLD